MRVTDAGERLLLRRRDARVPLDPLARVCPPIGSGVVALYQYKRKRGLEDDVPVEAANAPQALPEIQLT